MSEPVKCVCGGEAFWCSLDTSPVTLYTVTCNDCGFTLPATYQAVDEAKAVMIWGQMIRALNCHERLVEALKAALELATCSQPPDVFVKFEAILKPVIDATKE